MKKLPAVLTAPKGLRYRYFLKKVAVSDRVWTLHDDEGGLAYQVGQETFVPLWATAVEAGVFAWGQFRKFKPVEEPLRELLAWLDSSGYRVAVEANLNSGDHGSVRLPSTMIRDLEHLVDKEGPAEDLSLADAVPCPITGSSTQEVRLSTVAGALRPPASSLVDSGELKGVIRADAPDRYAWFLERVAWTREVWLLGRGDDYAFVETSAGQCLATWGDRDIAGSFIAGTWEHLETVSISEQAFKGYLEALEARGGCVTVMPNDDDCALVGALSLQVDLAVMDQELG